MTPSGPMSTPATAAAARQDLKPLASMVARNPHYVPTPEQIALDALVEKRRAKKK